MQKYKTKPISIAGRRYTAIIADTSTKRAIGLMFRESMPKKYCMVFLFGSDGYHPIWMRNMRFPIDALWLDKGGVVVDAKAGISPCASLFDCPQYSPKDEARFLIELNAGEIRRGKLGAGSKARI